jgi:hypothetical protein
MPRRPLLAATFALACIGGLLAAAGGSLTVTGGATDGATVVITSTRDDIEDRYGGGPALKLRSSGGGIRIDASGG